MARFNFARTAWLLSCAWILAVGLFYYPKWNFSATESTLSWDVSGYYFYLPAIFIYKDLKMQEFKGPLLEKYRPTTSPYQSYPLGDNTLVMKYSSGMAVMYAPFFFMAHLLAGPLGYEADGFSFPYQLAIGLGSLLVALLGLYLLYRILSLYFSSLVTGLVLLLYVFGTNYLEYAAISNAMSHNYLFTLYALLIWITIRYYQQPGFMKAAGIGLIAGLATLARPTEVVSLLIPLLWGLGSAGDLKERLRFIRSHFPHYLLAAGFFILATGIQLVYWKWVSGDWLVYSYQEEKLLFTRPFIYKCLFSFRKGWFIYTPLMLLIIPGYYWLYRKRRELFWTSFIFGLLFMYLCFSWSIWWYAGSIGQRAMVQAYPVLALPVAAALEMILQKKIRVMIAIPFFALAIYYNLWLHHQAHRGGLLDAENMTRAYWQKILFRYHLPEGALKLLDTNESFEGARVAVVQLLQSEEFIRLDSAMQFSKEYAFFADPVQFRWVRVQASVSIGRKEENVWSMCQMVLRFKKGGEVVKEKLIRLQRHLNEGETKILFMDVLLPGNYDRAELYFWNSGSKLETNINGFTIEAYNE